MYNVRDWLAPINLALHNITNPHIFVITKNTTGDVVLRYKNWSRDTEWLPSKDSDKGITIVKQVSRIQILAELVIIVFNFSNFFSFAGL